MGDITLEIDGKSVAAEDGTTVLEAARSADIFIPTLCHNDMLEPYGGCRLCTVEVESRGRKKLVASCLYPVEPDLIVRTRTEMVDKVRKLILEFLLAHAPDSVGMNALAAEYGAKKEPLWKGILVLHPVRFVRPILRRGQTEKRHRIRGPGRQTGDQLHSRAGRPILLGLQGMLSVVSDVLFAGRIPFDPCHRISVASA